MDLIRAESKLVEWTTAKEDKFLLGDLQVGVSHAHSKETCLEFRPEFGKTDEVELWGNTKWKESLWQQTWRESSIDDRVSDPLEEVVELLFLYAVLHERRIKVVDLVRT